MSEQPNVEYGDRGVALPNEILRSVVGSGVHGIAIEGTARRPGRDEGRVRVALDGLPRRCQRHGCLRQEPFAVGRVASQLLQLTSSEECRAEEPKKGIARMRRAINHTAKRTGKQTGHRWA